LRQLARVPSTGILMPSGEDLIFWHQFMTDEKRKFLYRCDDCQMIVALEFSDSEDIEDIMNEKMILECVCQGKTHPIFN